MTREEAIEILRAESGDVSCNTVGVARWMAAIDMAISALRQQGIVTNRNGLTNADRIRAMTDEEIAECVCENGAIKTPCDIICGGDCKALATFDKSSMDVCKEIVMKWLQKPAEEDDQ